jgi:hypothetical protein
VITSEVAHGTISAQRTQRRPGKRSLSSWASASEISIVGPTISTTHFALLDSTCTNDASVRTRSKLRQPTNRVVSPEMFTSNIDVRAISKTG